MLTLAAAMIDPSYAKLKKPHHEFHRAWKSKTLGEDHILYAAMDAYLLFKYLHGLGEEAEPSVRFKQRSVGEEEEEEGRGRSRGRGLGLRVGVSAVAHAGSTAVSR